MDNVEFGKYLLKLRKEKGWTQEELAEKIHVSNKTISKWETGAGLPDIHMLEPLADVLGVTVLELIKSKDTMELNMEDVGDTISEVIDIAEHQRKLERKNLIMALLLATLLTSVILGFDLARAEVFCLFHLPYVLFAIGIVLIVYALRTRKHNRRYKMMLVFGLFGLIAPLMPALIMIGCLCLLKLQELGILSP